MRSRLVLAVLALAALSAPADLPARAAGGVWTSTMQATQGFDHLSAFKDGTFYAQYLDSYARSTDAGLTWEVMPKPPGHYYGAPGIRFASPKVGVAVGGTPGGDLLSDDLLGGGGDLADEIKRCGGISPVRRTLDGGATWRGLCVPRTSLTSDPRWGPDVAPLAFAGGGRTIMVAGNEEPLTRDTARGCGDDNDVIYTSHDVGARWIRAALPRGWYGGYRQAAYDSRTLARISYGNYKRIGESSCGSSTTAVFVSRDGGRSFRRALTCAPHPCTSVAMPSRNKIVVGRTDGSTMVSDDAGRRWRRGQRLFDARWQPVVERGEMSADSFWVQGISFSDARHGFASTRGSGTWRTTDGGISWTQERSHECAWFLWGIGEVAAGTADTAITGGPHFISARTPVDGVPRGCGGTEPQLPAVTGGLVATGTTVAGDVRLGADGSLTVVRR